MIENRIGETAGTVYRFLENNGTSTPSKLKKALSISTEDMNLALGWLAREDKLSFAKTKSSMTIILR